MGTNGTLNLCSFEVCYPLNSLIVQVITGVPQPSLKQLPKPNKWETLEF